MQCERCGHVSDKNQTVFITDMGTAWHTDRHCSGFKRTMDGMSQKEAEQSGLRPSSRCGASGGGDAWCVHDIAAISIDSGYKKKQDFYIGPVLICTLILMGIGIVRGKITLFSVLTGWIPGMDDGYD